MFDEKLEMKARQLLELAFQSGVKIVTAESCTGGLVSALLTSVPGSSTAFERGFVTYSNRSKTDLLGVPGEEIVDFGAVSERVSRSMAEGAIRNSRADLALSVTGIAGPGGGTALKPVGLVHIACAQREAETIHKELRFGDIGRSDVRKRTMIAGLELLTQRLSTDKPA